MLGSQPAGEVSHKPGGRLPLGLGLLSTRPAVTPATLKRVRLLPILLLGEQRHNGCEQFAQSCYPTASLLRFEPRPFCAWVQHQHANHSATEPPFAHEDVYIPTFHNKELNCRRGTARRPVSVETVCNVAQMFMELHLKILATGE